MRSRLIIPVGLVLLAIFVPDSQLSTSPRAQSPTEQRPKLKEFGSSLKRLKWDPEKQATVETKSSADQRNSAVGEDVIRIDTDLVVCDVLVLDAQGKTVQGLTQSDFTVTEDGQPQKVSHLSPGDDVRIERSIVLIIDHSISQAAYIETSVKAAKTLVDQLSPQDRMAIVTDDVELLVDFTRDKARLKTALDTLVRIPTKESDQGTTRGPRWGRSDQFSALLATVRELVSREDIRPIIIFQTDGDELNFLQPANLHRYQQLLPADASDKKKREFEKRRAATDEILKPRIKEVSLSYVLAAAEKSHATVYSVIPGIQFMGAPPEEQLERARQDLMNYAKQFGTSGLKRPKEVIAETAASKLDFQSAVARVATITGGWTAFLEKPAQAEEIYSRILSDVNSRYVLGYYPSNKIRDGARHTVLIEVRNQPEYKVFGRKTYYAREPAQ